jgi:alpha-methylacyl-CoA racemase
VLDWNEAQQHAHLAARSTFVTLEGIPQPAPAPRLSRTAPVVTRPAPYAGEHSDEIRRELGR